jgi:DnaJ-class molecular chaperone
MTTAHFSMKHRSIKDQCKEIDSHAPARACEKPVEVECPDCEGWPDNWHYINGFKAYDDPCETCNGEGVILER